MKLVYVTSMLPFGPMEAFFVPEIRELRRRGHELLIVPMHARGPVMHEDALAFLPFTEEGRLFSAGIAAGALLELLRSPLRALRAVALLLGSGSPGVLLKNLAVLPKGLWLARRARRWGADHIHAQWLATSGTLGLVASTLSGIPWSCTGHRWDIVEDNLLREKSRSARFLRVISAWGAELLRSRTVPGARIEIVHMGVPRGDLASAAPRRPASAALRVLMAANFLAVKGHTHAIEAAALLRRRAVPVQLDLAGDGPLRAELEARVARDGLRDAVRFLGVVSHADLLAGMRGGRWDVAMLSSVDLGAGEKEGIPVFLIEAMSAGLPVVSTRTGGIPELLGGGGGLLVEGASGAALAEALERIFRDPDLGARLGEEAIRVIEGAFTLEGAVDALERLLAGAHAG